MTITLHNKKRLKDVTHDEYGYDDDEATTKEVVSLAWMLGILGFIVFISLGFLTMGICMLLD